MSESADLTFVHVSDIHFQKGLAGTKYDLDREIQEKLATDLRKLVPRFGTISGIIITGDVAFSGHPSEYRHAMAWVKSVAEHLQCPLKNVMVIPGNHDIDRSELEKNQRLILKLQRKIRKGADPAKTVARLAGVLSKKDGKLLLAPLKSYNRFAAEFGCSVTRANPYWERPFRLGDGTTLRIRGLTSTWLCGPEDSERTRKLLYGSAQYAFEEVENTYHVAAAHHPPQNMIDGDEASRAFDFYCKLQLFGHKHDHWTSSSRTCVRIAAGALQPDRREKPWTPRYNILQLSGEPIDKAHRLLIRIFPRRWSEEFRLFMADFTPEAKEMRDYEFFS